MDTRLQALRPPSNPKGEKHILDSTASHTTPLPSHARSPNRTSHRTSSNFHNTIVSWERGERSQREGSAERSESLFSGTSPLRSRSLFKERGTDRLRAKDDARGDARVSSPPKISALTASGALLERTCGPYLAEYEAALCRHTTHYSEDSGVAGWPSAPPQLSPSFPYPSQHSHHTHHFHTTSASALPRATWAIGGATNTNTSINITKQVNKKSTQFERGLPGFSEGGAVYRFGAVAREFAANGTGRWGYVEQSHSPLHIFNKQGEFQC